MMEFPELDVWGALILDLDSGVPFWLAFGTSQEDAKEKAEERLKNWDNIKISKPQQSVSTLIRITSKGAEDSVSLWLAENDVLGAENQELTRTLGEIASYCLLKAFNTVAKERKQ